MPEEELTPEDIEGVFDNPMQPEEPEEVQEEVVEEVEEKPVQSNRKGHKTKEEWENAGRDPDAWVDETEFGRREQYVKEMDNVKRKMADMERENSQRLENQRAFMDMQAKQRVEDLQVKLNEAAAIADVEEVNRIQGQMANVPIMPNIPQQAPQIPQEVDQWNHDNPWIKDNTPKAVYARNQYMHYGGKGLTEADALDLMKKDIAREYPNVNPNIPSANIAEKGSRPGKKQSRSIKLAYTKDELNMKASFPGWDDKEFEQAVRDSRGEKNA